MNDKLSNVVIELSLYTILTVLLKSIGEVYSEFDKISKFTVNQL